MQIQAADHSLVALQALHTSWKNQARELGYAEQGPVPVMLAKKVLLVGSGDDLSIVKKPASSFCSRLIKFLFGYPQRENFRLQVLKIQQLFDMKNSDNIIL